MKPSLLDPAFVYVPAAAHDSDPNAFRRRMRKRRREAQAAAEAARANVRPIVPAKRQAKA